MPLCSASENVSPENVVTVTNALGTVGSVVLIVIAFIVAAVVTPPDVISQLALAVPMVILYLISEVIARAHDRRKARSNPNAGLSPDELSPI